MQAEILRQVSFNTVAVRLLSTDAHNDVVMQLTYRGLKGNAWDLKHASAFHPIACVIEDLGRFNGKTLAGSLIRLTGAPTVAKPQPRAHPPSSRPHPPRPRSVYFD